MDNFQNSKASSSTVPPQSNTFINDYGQELQYPTLSSLLSPSQIKNDLSDVQFVLTVLFSIFIIVFLLCLSKRDSLWKMYEDLLK